MRKPRASSGLFAFRPGLEPTFALRKKPSTLKRENTWWTESRLLAEARMGRVATKLLRDLMELLQPFRVTCQRRVKARKSM